MAMKKQITLHVDIPTWDMLRRLSARTRRSVCSLLLEEVDFDKFRSEFARLEAEQGDPGEEASDQRQAKSALTGQAGRKFNPPYRRRRPPG